MNARALASDHQAVLTSPIGDTPTTRVRRFWLEEACAAVAVEALILAGEPLDSGARTIAKFINRQRNLKIPWCAVSRWRQELSEAAAGNGDWPDESRAFAREHFAERVSELRGRVEAGENPWTLAASWAALYSREL